MQLTSYVHVILLVCVCVCARTSKYLCARVSMTHVNLSPPPTPPCDNKEMALQSVPLRYTPLTRSLDCSHRLFFCYVVTFRLLLSVSFVKFTLWRNIRVSSPFQRLRPTCWDHLAVACARHNVETFCQSVSSNSLPFQYSYRHRHSQLSFNRP